ncbi:uncharacterized protein LOC135694002 isoform X2 [Rhopilema esculentum]|eukprot:gene10879-19702_t
MADNSTQFSHDVNRAIHDLRDKFKHGNHIIKILESQLETARQNISLLQGQVRLANETIDNLKQQFNEAELTLAYLSDNSKGSNERRVNARQPVREMEEFGQGTVYVSRSEDHDGHRREYEKHSPKGGVIIPKSNEGVIGDNDQAERTKSPASHEKTVYGHERPKSPYAQQLRQVLDALQDEDSRKMNVSAVQEPLREVPTSSHSQPAVCDCPDCIPPSSTSHRHYQSSALVRGASCGCEFAGSEIHYHEECSKHTVKAMTRAGDDSPMNRPSSRHVSHHENVSTAHVTNVTHSSHQVDYSSQCTGPCCSSIDLSKGYKIVEKSPGLPHYIAPRSPRRHKQHELRHDPHCQMVGHCDDKCRCHTFVNYAPFGYQVLESAPGVPQTIQPISPGVLSKKTKRYLPLAPGDEPPHLKYTKVKRIDGSKVAAQKTIQDFSKRRLQPYNPRWDLDLLIVPPPMPASELFTALGLEQEAANFQPGREITASDSILSNESMSIENRCYESPVLKSKVINAGGTVIVLTESDSRVPVTHTVPGTEHAETSMQHTGSFGNQTSFTEDQELLPQRDNGLLETHEIKMEKNSDSEANGQADAESKPAIHSEFQIHGSPGIFVGNKDSSEMVIVKSNVSDLPRAMLNKTPGGCNTGYDDSSFRSKSQGKMEVETERNNNSFPKRTMASLVSRETQDGHNETVLDGTSNLTARYEKVLFQRNQDYSRLTADDEYIINNRAKGKVH